MHVVVVVVVVFLNKFVVTIHLADFIGHLVWL